MCGLSTSQVAIAPAKLKELYKSKQAYVKAVEKRLDRAREGRLVAAGLPGDDPRRRREGEFLTESCQWNLSSTL